MTSQFISAVSTLARPFAWFDLRDGWQLRLTLERLRKQERALGAARGDLARIIDAQFAAWFVEDLLQDGLADRAMVSAEA